MPTWKYPKNTLYKLKSELYGEPIPGSSLFRSYCPRCSEPIRITRAVMESGGHPFCERCNPKHRGCSSPSSPLDPDAHKVSTQDDYGNIPGN